MEHPLVLPLEQDIIDLKLWYTTAESDEERSEICERVLQKVSEILGNIESANPPVPDQLRPFMYEQMEMFIGAVNYLEDDDMFTQHCRDAMVLVRNHRDSFLTKVNLYLMLKHFERRVEKDMDDGYNLSKKWAPQYERLFLDVLYSYHLHAEELPHLNDTITALINKLHESYGERIPLIRTAAKSLSDMQKNVEVIIWENELPVAVAMALHPRLGKDSHLGELSQELVHDTWLESLKLDNSPK